MCKYENKKSKNSNCIYPKLFEDFEKNKSEFSGYNCSLPIDEDGFCLFHSRNIEWKRENNFISKFISLIEMINHYEEITSAKTKSIKYDFSGFILIGLNNVIDLSDIHFLKYPDFDNAIFYDSLLLNNVDFSQGALFESAKFKESVEIKNSKFALSTTFNNAVFEDSFSCIDTLFAHAVIFSDTIFKKIVSFRKCTFEYLFMFDDVRCTNREYWATFFNLSFKNQSLASFNRTKFEGLVKFENIEFGSDVSFIYSEFNLNENTDPNNFSVNFNNIALNNDATMKFKGRKPFERMFKDEVFFTFNEVIGKIHFENVDFNSMDAGTLKDFKLLEEKDKLIVGNGCVREKINNVHVFISSQDILHTERDFIEKIIREKNDGFVLKQIYLKPEKYENVDKGNTENRIQDEFMNLIDLSEYFILILWNSIGNYSKKEFEYAISNRLEGKNPEKILILNKTNNTDFDEKYRDLSFDVFLSDLKNNGIYIINFSENLTIYRELNLLFNEIEKRYKSK
ncbi:hypothetical protein SDC9_40317 [bioreactor metagenome]|uniref:Uncharacterized protein n=1 Tax=bioreactor metagenome TaxID=1076179 RepID=A0A644VRZ6_9ZZZZ